MADTDTDSTTTVNVYKLLYDEYAIYVDGEQYTRRDMYTMGDYLVDVMNEYDVDEASIEWHDISGEECTQDEDEFVAKLDDR